MRLFKPAAGDTQDAFKYGVEAGIGVGLDLAITALENNRHVETLTNWGEMLRCSCMNCTNLDKYIAQIKEAKR